MVNFHFYGYPNKILILTSCLTITSNSLVFSSKFPCPCWSQTLTKQFWHVKDFSYNFALWYYRQTLFSLISSDHMVNCFFNILIHRKQVCKCILWSIPRSIGLKSTLWRQENVCDPWKLKCMISLLFNILRLLTFAYYSGMVNKSYQMNPANYREALVEVREDESEGADILLVSIDLQLWMHMQEAEIHSQYAEAPSIGL